MLRIVRKEKICPLKIRLRLLSVSSAGLVPLRAGPGRALPRAGPVPPDEGPRRPKRKRRPEVVLVLVSTAAAVLRRGRGLRGEGGRREGEAGEAGRGCAKAAGARLQEGEQVRGRGEVS